MLIQNTTSAVNPVRFGSNVGVATVAPRGDLVTSRNSETPEPQLQPTIAQLENVVRELNQSMRANNSNLAFSIDQETQQTVIKVVDSKTGEMIKQFPSKEAIAIAKAIGDIQQGLLLKQKA